MAGVEWIKLDTDTFNNNKIKLIQAMPKGDTLLVIWFHLLTLAGISNTDGYLMLEEDYPYTDQMLAKVIHRPLSVIQRALKVFQDYKMLQNTPNGFLITNFLHSEKSNIKEYNRQKKAESRERIKEKSMTSQENVNDKSKEMSMTEKEREREKRENEQKEKVAQREKKEKEKKETEKEKEAASGSDAAKKVQRLDYSKIASLYNTICKSLPKVQGLSDKRQKKIKTLINHLDKEKIWLDLDVYARLERIFRLAEGSDFLSGREKPNTWCGLDWLLEFNNALKVIEGNYNNRKEINYGANGSSINGVEAAAYPSISSEAEENIVSIFRSRKNL